MSPHRNRRLACRRVLGAVVVLLGATRASAQRTQNDAHVTFTPSAAVARFTYAWDTRVVESKHTGIFAPMLFDFDTPGGFTTTLDPIEFDYGIPDPSGGSDPLDVGVYFFTSRSTATITPEPSTLVLLGSAGSLLLLVSVRRRRAGRSG